VPHETGVLKLPLLAFETSQPKHSSEEAIDEIERFAWFSYKSADE
jgi:hypothetical protein